jgi:hypothetical protein
MQLQRCNCPAAQWPAGGAQECTDGGLALWCNPVDYPSSRCAHGCVLRRLLLRRRCAGSPGPGSPSHCRAGTNAGIARSQRLGRPCLPVLLHCAKHTRSTPARATHGRHRCWPGRTGTTASVPHASAASTSTSARACCSCFRTTVTSPGLLQRLRARQAACRWRTHHRLHCRTRTGCCLPSLTPATQRRKPRLPWRAAIPPLHPSRPKCPRRRCPAAPWTSTDDITASTQSIKCYLCSRQPLPRVHRQKRVQ